MNKTIEKFDSPIGITRPLLHFCALSLSFPLLLLAKIPHGRALTVMACILGVLINLFLLPKTPLGKKIQKPGEGWSSGIVMYPFSLALAFLFFPPYAVAAAWAALAAGDSAASILGSRLPMLPLPWNPQKSMMGLLAFVTFATPVCYLLLLWCPVPLFMTRGGSPELPYHWVLAISAAFVGGGLESLRGPFDDNLRITLGVSFAIWMAALFFNLGAGMPQARAFQPEWLIEAVLINLVLGATVYFFSFSDLAGAIGGGIAGTAIYYFTLRPGYALLIFFVLLGSLLTHVKHEKKERLGVAEGKKGRRGISNVLANLSVPFLFALVYLNSKGHPAALLAIAGALAAALADTSSSEIGTLSSTRPRLILSGKEVSAGTDGGVTWLGHGAALVSLILFCALAWAAGFWEVVEYGHERIVPPVTPTRGLLFSSAILLAGFLGSVVDSILGEWAENRVAGVGKGTVNFLCTLAGGLVAGGLGLLFF